MPHYHPHHSPDLPYCPIHPPHHTGPRGLSQEVNQCKSSDGEATRKEPGEMHSTQLSQSILCRRCLVSAACCSLLSKHRLVVQLTQTVHCDTSLSVPTHSIAPPITNVASCPPPIHVVTIPTAKLEQPQGHGCMQSSQLSCRNSCERCGNPGARPHPNYAWLSTTAQIRPNTLHGRKRSANKHFAA
jgi:hypothetical protein